MLHPEIEIIDSEVQTSLEYLDHQKRQEIEKELRKLREDKSLLEGKIKGYLTLSDICHEYKEKLAKLHKEYNQLKQKVDLLNSSGMTKQPLKSESPTPDNDLGTVNGREHEHRTQSHFSSPQSNSFNVGSVASNILREKDLPVRTKELFDLVEDPPKSSERTKSMPHSAQSGLPYQDKYPMQESIAHESSKSASGFERIPSDDLVLGQSAGNPGYKQSGDLINFSSAQSPSYRKQISGADDENDLENILKSVQLDSGKIELNEVIKTVKSYSKTQQDKLQKTNELLLIANSDVKKRNKQLEDENRRLLEKIRSLEQQLLDLSSSVSRSMSQKDSSHPAGWVHVEKITQNGLVTKTTEPQQRAAVEDMEMLKQKNQQLTEANQRWSNEWNKLVAHYDGRVADLQTERDRLAKELTEFKISEEAKQRDYEKMLMNAKKKASDEENDKEEAYLLLTSANNRAEALQTQLAECEDLVSGLRREKQVLETELNVIRQRPVMSPGSPSEGSRTTRNTMELQTENDVLRQQLLVFQEDFDRERQDRAKAQSLKDDYKKQNEQYKKRLRHLEQKNLALDRQVKTAEDSAKRSLDEVRELQQENATLKLQLQREQERSRNFIPSQMAYQPMIQSAGMQPHRQVIFGQQVQPRPQQYVIPPTYEQRVPQLNGGIVGYVPSPGSQYQQVVSPPAPYYQANQAGKQTEYKVGSWSCNQCTYVNYPGRTVCELCGYIQSPSAGQNNFVYRQNGNETLHARGEPRQQPPPPQPPPYGYGGQSTPRDITTDNYR